MGCQACSGVDKNEEVVLKEILRSIQSENTSGLTFYLKSYLRSFHKNNPSIINSNIIIVNNFKISFLGYSLVAGSVKSFRVIHEKFSASIPLMIENFNSLSMNTLNILCEKNHFDLVKYYLPLYLKYRPASVSGLNDTLDFHNTKVLKESCDLFTPMQVACLYGSIPIVDYFFNYNMKEPNPLFNIEEINEETGENCALLAVRSGQVNMVQLVHKKYKQDFSVKNKFGESALQICAVSSAKKPDVSFLETFMYLIEEVKIDYADNFEDIFIVLTDKEIINYYEKKLVSIGVQVNRRQFDFEAELRAKVMAQQLLSDKNPPNESFGKCSLGSTIFQDFSNVSFITKSMIGSKGWV